MRESIGGAMMLRIFLVVIVIFVVFLCVSANFARAFRVKNSVITIIEQYEGINNNSLPEIEKYISRMGYSCGIDKGYREVDGYSELTSYVLKRTDSAKNGDDEIVKTYDDGSRPDKIYNVQVCVDWNFPIIDAFGTWRFIGKTEVIKNAVE